VKNEIGGNSEIQSGCPIALAPYYIALYYDLAAAFHLRSRHPTPPTSHLRCLSDRRQKKRKSDERGAEERRRGAPKRKWEEESEERRGRAVAVEPQPNSHRFALPGVCCTAPVGSSSSSSAAAASCRVILTSLHSPPPHSSLHGLCFSLARFRALIVVG